MNRDAAEISRVFLDIFNDQRRNKTVISRARQRSRDPKTTGRKLTLHRKEENEWIRAHIKAGRLPEPEGHLSYYKRGDGSRCSCCAQCITDVDVQSCIESLDARGSWVSLAMHVRCFEAWRAEGRSLASERSAETRQHIIGLAQGLWKEAHQATDRAHQMQSSFDDRPAARSKSGEIRRYWRDNVLDSVIQAACAATRAIAGYIQVLEPGVKRPVVRAHKGLQSPVLEYFDRIDCSEAPYSAALNTGRRIIVDDAANDPILRNAAAPKFLLSDDARSVQATPLIGGCGQALGVLSTHYRCPSQLDSTNLTKIDQFAQQAVSIVEWHRRAVANL